MPKQRTCARCGAALRGAAARLCPSCLLRGGLRAEPEPGARTGKPPAGGGSLPTPISSFPQAFGDYELLEVIARGGMGVVYKARQKSLNRLVAVKMLLSGPFAQPKFVQRFRAEAEAAAQLQHPNIVAIHEIGECDGQPFFSMDYVEGKNLAQMCVDLGSRGVEFRRGADWLKTIAEAVQYAHQRGIIHRDLKPSNVLIDSFGRPRITDFGLAKRLTGDSDLTLSGQVLGSPNYLPPEQAEPKRGPSGPSSDIYGLGAILYHLVTGRPPFQAESLTTLLRQVIETEPVAPRSLNPSMPEDLETICLKCLDKEPARRYTTARSLAEELARFLRNEPILARPVGPVGKAWKWCRRRPALAALTAALVATFATGLIALLWQLQQTRAEKLTAEQNAYAADMNLAHAAVEDGDLGAAMALLEAHRPRPGGRDFRGWEWRYLWQRCRGDELYELVHGTNEITEVIYSPNGRWLAVRDSDDNAVLWDTGSRQPTRFFRLWDYLKGIRFSKKGDLFAYTIRSEPAIAIVNLNTWQQTALLPHTTNIVRLAFSADAASLFTLDEEGRLTKWELATGQPVHSSTLPVRRILPEGPAAFSPDGDLLAFRGTHSSDVAEQRPDLDGDLLAFRGEHSVALYDLRSERLTQLKLAGTNSVPTALRFSPDGKLLAAGVGNADAEILVWAVEDLWQAKETAPPPRAKRGTHRDWISELDFSPDGTALISAGADSSLRVWDLAHPEVCRRYQGHKHQVSSVAWSPDGRLVVSGSRDGSVRVWDPWRPPTPHGPAMLPIVPHRWYGHVRLSSDGKRAIALDSTNLVPVLWDVGNVKRIEDLDFAGTNVASFAWSSDERRLATGDNLGNVRVWDLPSRRLVASFVVPGSLIRAPRFSPDGRFLACVALVPGDWINPIYKAWDLDDGREIPLPAQAMRDSASMDLSPDWRRLVALHHQGTLEVWDIRSGRCRVRQSQPLFGVTWSGGSVVCAPDGRTIASATLNGVLAVSDAEGRRPLALVPRSTQELWDLSFSPDSTRLLVSGKRASDVVRLLDVSSKRFVLSLPGKSERYWIVRMCADGNTIYAAGEETVLVWRAPSWAEIDAAERN